ncbi:phage family protein [Xanthomonas sp. NCPPB 1128]|uniref:Gp49 family protein n=1 Tax=Xanthomonas sp. NCPPB 1128 TaxID=1775876 RepID=UPI00065AFA37|nr:Gp49 family protein [Xanthomonas sp. NCPPB 1128]KMM77071.1 phage family protein [Xanthomonas sp. NCPPB 1128]KMM77115.1 phage family protein [Xanthomonas sp. NCPPB 1128]
MTDHQIEQEIQAKGLTAPRVKPADIEAEIASEYYFTASHGAASEFALTKFHGEDSLPHAPLEMLTFCVLVLRNGFTVTGESACASPENFDAEIGRKIARQNAVAKVWPLLGFRLRDKLAG